MTDSQDRGERGRNGQRSVDWSANPGKIKPEASLRPSSNWTGYGLPLPRSRFLARALASSHSTANLPSPQFRTTRLPIRVPQADRLKLDMGCRSP